MTSSASARASVVVTGASSGLGAAIATRLAADGWAVVAVGRNQGRLDGLASAIAADGGAVAGSAAAGRAVACVAGDVADRSTHVRALAAALEMAPLGGWVNCAGITVRNALHELDEASTSAMIEGNELGTLWGCQVAVTHWVSQPVGVDAAQRGAIVNMSSVHGRRAYPDHTVYEMTKAAIEALTRSIAISYGARGIRANAVAPGAIRTPALDATFAAAPDPAAAESDLAARSPLRRIGEAAEVAAVVAFLLSNESAYVSGQSIAIDGGWTAALGSDPSDPAARRAGVGS